MKNWIDISLEKHNKSEILDFLLNELVAKEEAGGHGKDNMSAILI